MLNGISSGISKDGSSRLSKDVSHDLFEWLSDELSNDVSHELTGSTIYLFDEGDLIVLKLNAFIILLLKDTTYVSLYIF